MIIIWGSKLYGKVDVVPGLFHVETKFGHLWYIPLIPVESYVVLGKGGDGFNGVRIPLSFKSVVYAWLRAATLIAGVVGSIGALAKVGKDPSGWITPAIVGASSLAAFAVLTFARGSTHASYDRAIQLGEMLGLSPAGRQRIDQIYGYRDGQHDPFAPTGQGG
jgi:hypothetical protein